MNWLWRVPAAVISIYPLLTILLTIPSRVAPVNRLIPTIPVDSWPAGGFTVFPPVFVSTLASVTSIFVMWLALGRRRRRWSPIVWFVAGVSLLIVYFGAAHLIVNDFYWKIGWARDDPGRLLGDVLLLVAYCGGFALMTGAFALLGGDR